MRITKVKKVWSHQLQQKLKKDYLQSEVLDYRIRKFFDDICDDGLYEFDYPKNKPKLRITFLPFLFFVFIITIVGCIKWLICGSNVFASESFIIKKMIAWDRYCRFGIL
jgi:hypothetical protein